MPRHEINMALNIAQDMLIFHMHLTQWSLTWSLFFTEYLPYEKCVRLMGSLLFQKLLQDTTKTRKSPMPLADHTNLCCILRSSDTLQKKIVWEGEGLPLSPLSLPHTATPTHTEAKEAVRHEKQLRFQ